MLCRRLQQLLPPTRLVNPEGTDELFADDPTPDAQGDGEAALQDEQVKSVKDESRPLEEAKTVDHEKAMDEKAPIDQQ